MNKVNDNLSGKFPSGNRHPIQQKLLSVLLCVCLLLVSLPAEFFCSEVQAEELQKQILSFLDLSQELKRQTLEPGTPMDNLNLPETLEAVCIPLENEPAGDPEPLVSPGNGFEIQWADPEPFPESPAPDPEPDAARVPELESDTLEVPESGVNASQEETVIIENITWSSSPAYDPGTEGIYDFTPVLPEQYVLAEGVPLPVIQVTVKNTEDSQGEVESGESSAQRKKARSRKAGETENQEFLISPASEDIVIAQDTSWDQEKALSGGNLVIEEGATLTINKELYIKGNVTIRGKGTIARGKADVEIWVERNASLTIQGITLDGKGLEDSYAMIMVSGALKVEAGCKIQDCHTRGASKPGSVAGYGGAVYLFWNSGARAELLDCTISNCTASEGGAAYCSEDCTLILDNGCRIENCRAVKGLGCGDGGAIDSHLYNATIKLLKCTISHCSADGNGGAVHGNAVNLILGEGCNIEDCSAAGNGGAVSIWNVTADFQGCTISRCSAGRNGGAIDCGSATRPMNIHESCKIQQCRAVNGGAIYNQGSKLYINGGEISGNIATNAGGAIFHCNAAGTETYLSGVTLQGNSCTSEKYAGSGGACLSSEGAAAYETHFEMSGDVKFCGDGTKSGVDGIYLDSQNAMPRKIIVNETLRDPVKVYLEAAEHYVIAKGTGDYRLTEEDRKNLSFVDVGKSGKRWALRLDEDNNEIYLAETEYKTFFADFYSGGPELSEPVREEREVEKSVIEETMEAPALKSFPGWKPLGWSESSSKYTADIGTDGTCILTEAIREYYGIYGKNITLTYDPNGGNAVPDPETKPGYANVHQEVTQEFPKFTFAPAIYREGYTFVEWNTSPDRTGTAYKAGATGTLEQDTLLYAVWQQVSSGPETASYRVEHYCQNLTGEEYTRMDDDTEYLTGTVGAQAEAQPKTYVGFTVNFSHPYGKPKGDVEADGSLILKLYYDRNIYEIDFDLNGGYGAVPVPQKIRYGEFLEKVPDPFRTGYNFKGWYLEDKGMEEAPWDFDRPVENNTGEMHTTLYAKWADELAPALGEAAFSKGHQNFLAWIMQKQDLIVTVPVVEEGSGLEKAEYLLVSENGTEKDGEGQFQEIHALADTLAAYGTSAALIKGMLKRAEHGKYEVQFAVDEEFKGKVYLTCIDHAGNVSARKTLTAEGGGIIVEDNAPEIHFSNTKETAGGKPLDVKVTVKDDIEGHVTGGISRIRYILDERKKKALPEEDFAESFVEEYDFTVKIEGEGKHTLRVEAADHAGNESAAEITLKINGKRDVPAEIPDNPMPDGPGEPGKSLGGEPKTGDTLHVQVYATIAMIAGFSYLLLYFQGKNGIAELEKEEIIHRLVSWAKQGGSLRRILGLAVIFLFLLYYHSIGKSVDVERKKVYGK